MTTTLPWLRTQGTHFVDETGRVRVLRGVNFGNWFVQEGYMWRFHGPWDRPERIRRLVALLAGRDYARSFWQRFFDTYISEDDIAMVREAGFDSVRLPLDASLLIDDDPTGIVFLEDGFRRVEDAVRRCAAHGLYVMLDLHCAPGGQTGSNIDNSLDDNARMYHDGPRRRQTIALWAELARRFRDEPAISMYDLINEPVASPSRGAYNTDFLLDALPAFYRDCIAAIRAVDTRHIVSLEGAHWATDPGTFTESFDPQTAIHLHMYGDIPDERLARKWLPVAERLGAPLILGETGENDPAWVAAIFGQAWAAGISTQFWCWKKIGRTSPLSIRPPEGWDRIIGWTRGEPAPEPDEAQRIFDAYLDTLPPARCERTPMLDAMRRHAPLALRATDFDPGPDGSHAERPRSNPWCFREGTGMAIVELDGQHWTHGPGFNSKWEIFGLALNEGDRAAWSVDSLPAGTPVELVAESVTGAELAVRLEALPGEATTPAAPLAEATVPLPTGGGVRTEPLLVSPADGPARLCIRCRSGAAVLREIRFGAGVQAPLAQP